METRGRIAARLCTLIVACLSFGALQSSAQSYPTRPIRLILGFSTGGSADILCRLMAPKMSQQLGQSVIVENRPGASGAIATERVAKLPPDGYTLLLLTAGDTVLPAVRVKLPYDLEHDLAAVTLVMRTPLVLVVHPSVPARNLKELVAIARSHPGKLSFGSVGRGSTPHLMAEVLNQMAKIKTVHVPYKSGGESTVAVASGHIDMYFASLGSLAPLQQAGKIRPIAVSSMKRASFLPSIPSIHESGLAGYDRYVWQGVVVPSGVPKEIIARLNTAIAKSVNTPDMQETLNKQGIETHTTTPEEFGAFIHNEIAQNAKLIRSIGMKPE